MLLLPVEYSVPGSLEECHGVISMSMYRQLEGLILDVGVVNTPTGLPKERMVNRTSVLSVSNQGVDISPPINPSLVAGRRTRCLHL
jgi:hypothetical protein